MLESMSCGCTVIGSNTDPVSEVIQDNINGLLVPFQNSSRLSSLITDVLSNKNKFCHLGINARETIINNYNIKDSIPSQLSLIDAVARKVIVA